MSDPSLDHFGRADYDRLEPHLATLDVGKLPPYNLDATWAAGQAKKAASKLAPHRDAIAALPNFDISHLDNIVAYANALQAVNAALTARADRIRALPEMAAEGFELRSLLLAYGELLSIKGNFPKDAIERIKDGSGYRDLVDDLGTLVVLYGARPEVLTDASPVTRADVQRANALAEKMTHLVSDKAGIPLSQEELAIQRQRLGYLLTTAQRQLRRAMDYLRFEEGDAATLVPSLHVPKGRPASAEPTEPDLAEVHEQLHAQHHAHPDDNPFTDNGV